MFMLLGQDVCVLKVNQNADILTKASPCLATRIPVTSVDLDRLAGRGTGDGGVKFVAI